MPKVELQLHKVGALVAGRKFDDLARAQNCDLVPIGSEVE
jgi:hypothetical protein